MQNLTGDSALNWAVKNCHYPVVEGLLAHLRKDDANKLVNHQNKSGESALHHAATLEPKNTHYSMEARDIMRVLLKAGGDIFTETSEKGENPVHVVAKSGNIHTLGEMIAQLDANDAHAAANKQAKNGWPPLFYASFHGHAETVQMLLNQNARVDLFDDRGQAALHIAAELGHENVLDILLENKAFVNVRNKHGMTPLHLAAKSGFNSIVKRLVQDNDALLDAFSLVSTTITNKHF